MREALGAFIFPSHLFLSSSCPSRSLYIEHVHTSPTYTRNEQRTAPHLSQLHDADASDVPGVAAPSVEERMVASAYIGEPSGSQDGTPTTFNNQGRCHRRAPRAFQGPQHRTLMGQCLAVLMNASGNAVDCFRVTSTTGASISAVMFVSNGRFASSPENTISVHNQSPYFGTEPHHHIWAHSTQPPSPTSRVELHLTSPRSLGLSRPSTLRAVLP